LVTLGNFLHLKISGQLFNPFSSSAWFFQGGRTVALASQARRYPVKRTTDIINGLDLKVTPGTPEKPMESSL